MLICTNKRRKFGSMNEFLRSLLGASCTPLPEIKMRACYAGVPALTEVIVWRLTPHTEHNIIEGVPMCSEQKNVRGYEVQDA